MSVDIIVGDCRKLLDNLEENSVDCCVTSPPYWGLRDYGISGQLGLERSLGEHIDTMVDVFERVRRVLKPTGTLWLNYGDCYATSPNGRSAEDTKALGNDDRTFRDKPFSTIGAIYDPNDCRGGFRGDLGQSEGISKGRIVSGGYLKPKDLCMVPNRIAIALQGAGWWVRSEIIWAKPNSMPESVKDRPATSHEKVWMMSKSQKYFYDGEAVAERSVIGVRLRTKNNGESAVDTKKRGHDTSCVSGETKNLRNVWTIATAAFSQAHFATFPPELAERCIKAGCPEKGIVLDPFGGAGTTGLVADRLNRNAILLELNPEYAEMAEKRISKDRSDNSASFFKHVHRTKDNPIRLVKV